MERDTEMGRGLVLGVIFAALILSLVRAVAATVAQGAEQLPWQIVRFLLSVGLCVALYRGANWARWVGGVVFGAVGIGAMFAAMRATLSVPSPALVAIGLAYVAMAVMLLFVPAVRRFFLDARPGP